MTVMVAVRASLSYDVDFRSLRQLRQKDTQDAEYRKISSQLSIRSPSFLRCLHAPYLEAHRQTQWGPRETMHRRLHPRHRKILKSSHCLPGEWQMNGELANSRWRVSEEPMSLLRH